MNKKYFLIGLFFLCWAVAWAMPDIGIYTEEYGLSFFPDYPPAIGKEITLRLRTFSPAQRVTLYSDREEEIPLQYREGHWWGQFKIPENYKEGSHFFTVWIRYPFAPQPFSSRWSKSVVWYKVARAEKLDGQGSAPGGEAEKIPLIVTGEAVEITVASPEVSPLLIKGSHTISFSSRRLEGSREGYVPGTSQTREETLRINIAGEAADTEIEANLYRTSSLGLTQLGENPDEVSILLRRGNLEAYLGDFTADLTETEFSRLDRVLSGGKIKGDYERWGFTLLSSSPKGGANLVKMYGDGTQGPYSLNASANVVVASERVYVDGILQKRGDDYTIDYVARTITFIHKVIDAKSVIQVYYDYRETTYQHSTYGLRGFFKLFPNLKIGATYLNDSDGLSGAEAIFEETGTAPVGHSVFGADLAYVSEFASLDSEFAYSHKDLNLLSAGSAQESGRAAKLNLSSHLGPLGVSTRAKRVGASFSPVADPDPKQDVWEYGGGLSFRPSSLLGAQGNYDYEKYTQSGVVYENAYKNSKIQLTPEKLPSLEYNFLETDESNDPVTGSSIRRVITRNSVETIYQRGFLSGSLKGTTEKWLDRSPSEEATDYRKVNLGLSTAGLEKISLAGNLELEDRKEPDGEEPYRRTYNLNLSANPVKNYFVSSKFEEVDDSAQGKNQVLDLSYQAEPHQSFKTEGKYTINSLMEDFPSPGTAEAISKQTGSFSFDLRPTTRLRLRYLYKPNFTRLMRTQSLTYNNEQQQAEVNIIPFKEILLGWIYKLGKSFNIDNSDYPDYSRKSDSSDTSSVLYTLKMAPLQALSTEFDYLLEDSSTLTLNSTAEPITYTPGQGRGRKFDLLIKTPLTEKFSIDLRYTDQKTDQGTGESLSNLTDSLTRTGSLKVVWNITEILALTTLGSYSQSINNLSAADPETYTYSPGIGFIYRRGEGLRVDYDYTYSQSYAGATTVAHNHSLQAKYSLSDFVNITLRYENETSQAPDYRFTDFAGNIEINL